MIYINFLTREKQYSGFRTFKYGIKNPLRIKDYFVWQTNIIFTRNNSTTDWVQVDRETWQLTFVSHYDIVSITSRNSSFTAVF